MKEENTKKTDVIETLDNIINVLKDFTAYEHPIAYGIRMGLLASKDLILNAENLTE